MNVFVLLVSYGGSTGIEGWRIIILSILTA